jgi:hypothetical protein
MKNPLELTTKHLVEARGVLTRIESSFATGGGIRLEHILEAGRWLDAAQNAIEMTRATATTIEPVEHIMLRPAEMEYRCSRFVLETVNGASVPKPSGRGWKLVKVAAFQDKHAQDEEWHELFWERDAEDPRRGIFEEIENVMSSDPAAWNKRVETTSDLLIALHASPSDAGIRQLLVQVAARAIERIEELDAINNVTTTDT